jgi:hypothetical protein
MISILAEGEGIVLPFPAPLFGAIALTVFTVLALVTWSYRNVANRHDHKSSDSQGHH